ncbi:MAG: putative Growth arrest-specific protein 8 [Streblomastix strix]|uniref:Putative Growth arrest-specific protein 8 n=1 Tax=Streblomastix strix TaxID=222440 RepID=A0A5J4UEG2_9EUKA|nr:MAG: putative Growth arrest-specific protein 8 [Streblomastix strix]
MAIKLSKAEQKALDLKEKEKKEEQIQKVLAAKRQCVTDEGFKQQYVAERERLSQFITTTKHEIINLKADLRNRERLAEEKREKYRIERKEYLQKLNQLLYEHQNKLSQRKTEFAVDLARELDELRTQERENEVERRDAKERFKELDIQQSELFYREKVAHDREVSEIRQQQEMEVRELIHKYDEKIQEIRAEMEIQRKKEIQELNDAKRQQITKLTEKHLEEFHRIKAYYNETTHQEHFTLIEQLKGQVSEKKKIEAAQRKMLNQTASESKKEEDPLRQALEESERLRQRLKNWTEEKRQLNAARAREAELSAQVSSLSWEHEVLMQRAAQEDTELRELQSTFDADMTKIQQTAMLHGMLMEKKINKLGELVERKDAHIAEVLTVATQDEEGGGLGVIGDNENARALIRQKNDEIHQLEADLGRLTEAHRNIIKFYEGKLRQYDIPFEELGFFPLITSLAVPENRDEEEIELIQVIDTEVRNRSRYTRGRGRGAINGAGRVQQQESVPPYTQQPQPHPPRVNVPNVLSRCNMLQSCEILLSAFQLVL